MEEPNIVDKTKNLIGALANWAAKDSFNKVSTEQFNLRKSICVACPLWDQSGFQNLGKCTKCGCSVAKLYIPSSVCPDSPPKWSSVQVSGSAGKTP